jgi:site-specific recombinase XerD
MNDPNSIQWHVCHSNLSHLVGSPQDYRGRFGWHNLRHSLATFLADNDVSLSVIQRMLRHSRPTTTAIFTHRTNAVQLAAQGKFLDAINFSSAPV